MRQNRQAHQTGREETQNQAEKKAREIIATHQRYGADYVAEETVSVVNLPNEEMKGESSVERGEISGLEAACGVDLIVDDTRGGVISGFNPYAEIARITLED